MTIASQNLIEMLESEFDEVRTDYSGRSMYGTECVGIVIDGSEWEAAGIIGRMLSETDDSDDETTLNYMLNYAPSRDTLGLSSILYWPQLHLAGE